MTYTRVSETTVSDGVVPNQLYNSYVKFSGNTGLQISEPYIQLLTSYTFSLWFRHQRTPAELDRIVQIVTVKPSAFNCYFNKRQQLFCNSDNGNNFEINGAVLPLNWYCLAIRATNGKSNLQIREQSFRVFSQDTATRFFPFNMESLQFQTILLGIDQDQRNSGLVGSIRNLKLLNGYLEDTILQKIQYYHLYPLKYLRFQLNILDLNDYSNSAGYGVGSIVGSDRNPVRQVDYLGVFWCWTPTSAQLATYQQDMVAFSTSFTLQDLNTANNNYQTSLQMYVYRRYSTSGPNEVLFQHQNLLRLMFSRSDFNNLQIVNLNQASQVITVQIPFQRWYFIQVVNALGSLTATVFDSDGAQIFNQAVSFSTPVSQGGSVINIGQNFYGYIQGVKYFRTTSPSPNTIHAFKNVQDSNSDLLHFYLFTSLGVSSNSFRNFAQNGQNSQSVNSGITYNTVFFRDYGTSDTTGTADAPVYFDGYSCSDNKEKLYFPNIQSYTQVTIKNTQSLNQYTYEFWYRGTASVSNDAYMLVLQDRYQNLQSVIKQDIDNTMSCYSAFSANQKSSLLYLDYNKDANAWMHIACIYDGSAMQLRGTLYYSDQSYAYFSDIPTAATLTNQDYSLYMNTDPRSQTRGQQRAYYMDVRFWKGARTITQLQANRFHQLDVTLTSSSLFTYLKLTSGSTSGGNPLEYDYQDAPTFTRSLSVKGTQWQGNSEIVVCPLGMFKADKEQNCYREGTLSFLVVVYKTRNSYVISPTYSRFRNTYVREFASQIFDFAWTLDYLNPNNNTNQQVFPNYFASQQAKQNLEFTFDQVADKPGRYDFTLSMNDKMRMQNTQRASLSLKTYRCANIFDRETQLSLVNKDMDNIKGTDDAYFYYGVSDCADYIFDKTATQIVLEAPGGIVITNLDHIADQRLITLRAYNQPNLPLNELFYIRVKGLWRNTRDSNDIIEYYLIYACRYTSKLVVTLSPNLRTLLKGQTLSIDYKAEFFNIKNTQKDRSYTVRWQCPGLLQANCSGQTGSLKINYDMVANAGLDFWVPQPITLVAQTNFIQGDGSRFSNKSVDIIWLNVNPDARIASNSKFVNKQANISFQLDINSLKEDVVQVQWDVSPAVDFSCLINSNTRKQIVINSKCLSEGTTYTFTSRIIYNQQQQQIWTSSGSITVPRSPWGGSISCNTTTARAFIDPIRCTANGWNTQAGPLRFQFYTRDKSGILIPVSSMSGSNDFTGYFPPTTQLVVKAIDSTQGFNIAAVGANIYASPDTRLQQRITDLLTSSFYTKELANTLMIQEFQWIAGALQVYYNSTDQRFALSSAKTLTNYTYYQALRLGSFGSTDAQKSFIQGAVNIFTSLTTGNVSLNISDILVMQQTITDLLKRTDAFNNLYLDKDFHINFFGLQSNILLLLQNLQNSDEWDSLKANQTQTLSNITLHMRKIFATYETLIGTLLYEGEDFYVNSTALTFFVAKYSRMGSLLRDMSYNSPGFNLTYPLAGAKEPTFRQAFSMITFKINPFIGAQYLNQTASAPNAVYFSYRDEQGKYLDSTNIINKIQMSYHFEYSPFIFLPNVTVCGYIGTDDPYWENKSCSTSYNREQSLITCNCKHMSYYSVIDDYLVRPNRIPLINLTFKNWASFIVFMYILMIFIVGLIYTFNKDNHDFRYLHHQEEMQGHALTTDDSVGLVSLAFKRKVFFMDFSDSYSFCSLFRIYIMLLHPIFSLKYRMDPQIPRFSRFILLFTRVILMFALTFFILRDYKNFADIVEDPDLYARQVAGLIFFLIFGSLMFVPLPVMMLGCCRSRYYLINPKAQQRQDSEYNDPNGAYGEDADRVTDLSIDMSIPIKLLFLINAVSHEKLMKEANDKLAYGSGDLMAVGNKLYELDVDIQAEDEKREEQKEDSDKSKVEPSEREDVQQTQMELIGIRGGPGDIAITNRNLRQKTQESDHDQTKHETFLVVKEDIGYDEENLGEAEEESPHKDKKVANGTLYEGGEEAQEEEEDDSDVSIDTNLFIDEKKELVEEKNFYARLLGYGAAFVLNMGLIIAVLAVYVQEGYYNMQNPAVWVIAFFGTQLIGFIITDMLVLLLLALAVTKWFRRRKVFLAMFMREALYIYEDYKYVVQFAQTKIS